MKNKKAQVQSQIFVYIMVLIVGASILIFGYTSIQGFKKSADDVLYIRFETNFKNDLKTLSYESIKLKSYDFPNSVKQVCFYASEGAGSGEMNSYIEREQIRQETLKRNYKYPLILSSLSAGTSSNIFIYPKGERNFNAGTLIDLQEADITAQNHFQCFDVDSGSLKIRIKGQGNSVLVTEP